MEEENAFKKTKSKKDKSGVSYLLSDKYEQDYKKLLSRKISIKYIPAIHIPLLFKVFKEFDSEARFCAEALISRNTFNSWCMLHQDFAEAYNIAKQLGQTLWERLPFSKDKKIDTNIWMKIYNTRFKIENLKIPGIDSSDINIQIKSILAALENGDISMNQLGSVVDFLSKKEAILNNQMKDAEQPQFKIEFVNPQSIEQ